MLKKLGIAAACGVALYGLAKLLSRHVVVMLDETGPLFEPIASPVLGELAADHVAVSAEDVAPGLPTGSVASEDSPDMGAGTSTAQAANPTREPS